MAIRPVSSTMRDEFAVKVVLRLVDDKRRIAVGREHDGQQDRLLLAKR